MVWFGLEGSNSTVQSVGYEGRYRAARAAKKDNKDDLCRYYAIARPLQYHMVITGLHSSLLFIDKVLTMIIDIDHNHHKSRSKIV